MKLSNRKQPFTPEEFKDIYSRVPRITVEVIIKTSTGIILSLRQERSWQGQWHIPGGTVFYQEKLEDAVQRIAREEIGVEVEIRKLLGHIHYPSEVKERGFGWSIGAAFLCTLVNDNSFQETDTLKIFSQLPVALIDEQRETLEIAYQTVI